MAPEPYATLPELKSWLTGITGTDRDVMLTRILGTASRWVDGYCGRRFYLDPAASARTYQLRSAHADTVLIDDIGSLDGLAVEVGSSLGGFTAVTRYELTPHNALDAGWPLDAVYAPGGWASGSSGTLRVTARWGWPTVPDQVTQATLMQAGRLFKRKDSPEGVVGSAEWGQIRVGRVDPDVASLLAPYRLMAIG